MEPIREKNLLLLSILGLGLSELKSMDFPSIIILYSFRYFNISVVSSGLHRVDMLFVLFSLCTSLLFYSQIIKETSLLFIIINHKHFSSFNSSHMSFDSNMNNLVVRFTPSLCVIPGGEGEVFSTRVDSLRAFIWRSTHLLTRANGSTHLAVGGLTRLRVDPGLYKRTLC